MENMAELTISWGDISSEGVLLNVFEQIGVYKKNVPCAPDYAFADCGHKYQLQKEMMINDTLVLVKYNVFLRKPSHCHECFLPQLKQLFDGSAKLIFTTKGR